MTETAPAMAGPTESGGRRFLVAEIFGPTFQGEGPLAGCKTMFVRFAGCDFRCRMCDSLHAVLPELIARTASRLTAAEILAQLQQLAAGSGTRWVTLSGGNPALWDLRALCDLLHRAGFAIAVETQGSLAPAWLRACEVVVVSPKGPGMGEAFDAAVFAAFCANLAEPSAPGAALPRMFLKVVLFGPEDVELALRAAAIASQTFPGMEADGRCFFNLGNRFPPAVDPGSGVMQSPLAPDAHVLQLLADYRRLWAQLLPDPRIRDWRFLPQLHALLYSNQPGV